MKYKHLIQAAALALLTTSSLQAAPPANDNFANAVVITGTSGTQAGANAESTLETGEITNVDGQNSSASIWYRWTAPSSGTLTINTEGSSFDTLLYIATGSAVNALSILATDDDDGAGSTSQLSISVISGTTYVISISGYSGATGSSVLNWEIAVPPPNDNFADAQSLSGNSGTTTSPMALATTESGEVSYGSRSVWFVWTPSTSGQATINTIGSGNDTTLVLYEGTALNSLTTRVSNNDGYGTYYESQVKYIVTAGTTYRIRVATYDSSGILTAKLNWAIAPAAANDNFANATALSGVSGTASGDNTVASLETNETGVGLNSIWYSWTAPQTGKVVFDTLGSEKDTSLHIYTGVAFGSLNQIFYNNDSDLSSYGESLVKFSAIEGTTYRVRVSSSYGGAEGPMTLNWKMVSEPANNHFNNPDVITGTSGSVEANMHEATMEPQEPNFYGDSHSIWYAWSAPFTGVARFDTQGTPGYSTLTVGNSTELDTLNIVSDSSDYPAATCTFPVVSGTVYRIRISTYYEIPVKLNWQQISDFVPSVISLANATINTTESGPAATINLVRNGGTTTGPVSCYLTTLDGSANGADYSGTYTTVNFAEGATTASVNIPIYQDRRFEGEETFQVRLFAPSEEAAFGLSLSTVNIADDEPFIPLKANYAGLVQVFPFDNAMTGQLRINATGNGSFTGSLSLGGAAALPFSGSFNATGKASIPITRKTGGNVLLNLTYADNGNRIRAQVTAGGKTAEVQAWRIIFGGAVELNDKPFAFTTEVSISSIQPNAPKATGFLSVTVSPKGEVKIVGTLPDDTSFTAGGPLTGYDVFPLYVPLYGGKGCLSSDFMLNEGMQDSSAMAWHKPANSKDKIFPGGFTHLGYLNNSPYVFSKRTPIIGGVLNTQGAADFDASGPGLPAEGITQVFRLLEDNSIALPLSPQVKLTLKVAPGTGFLTGTFQRGTEKPTPFKGAVFQVFDYAAGFYLAPTGAGAAMTDGDIFIGPAF